NTNDKLVSGVLTVEDVSKNYGKYRALSNVSFDARKGEILAVLGPNGAGKTTLLKCCLGLLNFEGKIAVDGVDVKTAGAVARSKMGYVPQKTILHDKLRILDEVKLIARVKGVDDEQRCREVLERLGFWERRKDLVGSLSQGMKQKLMLGLTMLAEPDVLLLDEPLSSIDIEGQLSLLGQLELIKRQGKSIIMSSHIVGMGSVVDRVLILNRGNVVAFGEVDEVLSRLRVRNKLYIKLNNNETAGAELEENLRKEDHVYHVQKIDEWLIVECDSKDKAKVISTVIASGFEPEDIVSEAVSLEKHYYELIRR
ncbi:MAG: ABC transporter ATP-binding protein, partial [Candidatus Caldarchaeum sp.]|nr:ABC transporter ATP-binding protein [Candidatus Caldarchaeum sp.]